MYRKIYALPVVCALAILIGSQLFGPSQPVAQEIQWDVTTLDFPVADKAVPPAQGPGYKPKADTKCECVNCNCDELEKRVAALEAKISQYGTAKPTTTQGSAGGSGQASVTKLATTAGLPYGAVVTSERVVSRSPAATSTVTRTGILGRTVTRSVAAPQQSCRIVNGVRVCN